jgi:hypothetical protein
MIDGHAFHFDAEEDEHDVLSTPFESFTRTELIELLKDRDVRRRYINEFVQGDFQKLMGWIEATNTKKRASK